MSSQAQQSGVPQQNAASQAPVEVPIVPLPDNDEIEASDEAGSSFGASDGSETTSLNSAGAVYKGYLEHGRRYQSVREGDSGYFVPSDDRQFDHMQAQHLAFFILDSQQQNPFFRSPISKSAKNILDLGTGNADWAIGVADMLPEATVHGVDLYPPPQPYVPPNCILEVDDITKPWTFNKNFDLVHLRLMLGAFTEEEWTRLLGHVYDGLAPGAWFEHVDCHNQIHCDDGTMPKDSILANFHKTLGDAAEASGRVMFVTDKMTDRIKAAGFSNIHEKTFKSPTGSWAKHPIYREAGRLQKESMLEGFEGWMMFLMTRFGQPKPWSEEEVKQYVEKAKKELDQNWHMYQYGKRVWCQKPLDAESNVGEKPIVETAEAVEAA